MRSKCHCKIVKKKKRNKIEPVGFVIGLNKIYLTIDNGRLLVIDIASGKTISILKVDNEKISRPFILNNNFQLKNIFSGIPLHDYDDHKFTQKVKDHLKSITISNFKDNDFYKNYEYIIEFENYYEVFTDWINKKNIKKIGLPYVTKGNWKNIYKKLILENPSINFVYLHRKYDMDAWKFANKGFFNFKKHIPELISRL